MKKFRTIVVIILTLHWCLFAYGQTRNRLLFSESITQQYYVQGWTTDNGLSSNTLQHLYKDSQGYLWVSSYEGLMKFNGKDFSVFNKNNTPEIKVNGFSKIVEDKNGVIWIGTYGAGLLYYKNGKFFEFNEDVLADYSIQTLFIDSSNKLWIGTRGRGLYYVEGGKLKKMQQSTMLKDITINAILEPRKGEFWFGTDVNGVIKLKNGKFSNYTQKDGLPQDNVSSIFMDSKKVMWVGTNQGLCKFDGVKFVLVDEVSSCQITKIVQEEQGGLWVATSCGIYRNNEMPNKWQMLPIKEVISDDFITDVFVDEERNLWLSTYRAGLYQIKKSKFLNFTQLDGIATKAISSVSRLDGESFLIGSNSGVVNIIRNGEIDAYKFETQLPNTRIRTMLVDSKKNIWVGTSKGMLFKAASGEERWFTKENGLPDLEVRLFYEDRNGVVWFGTRSGGLVRVENDMTFTVFDKNNLLSSNFIMSIAEDIKGNLWVGTNENGITIMNTDGTVKYLSTRQGLASNVIFNTYFDAMGITWVVTNAGISRIENGNYFNFNSEHGLPTDAPFDILEDKNGNFWIPTSRGITRVKRKQLNDYATSDGQGKIDFRLFDKEDGLVESECTGAAKSLITAKGELWVPTLNGVVVVETDEIGYNAIIPPVFVSSLTVDDKSYNVHDEIILDAKVQRIVIDYEALNFTSPNKTKYKFQLTNFDDDWGKPVDQHNVHYTNLTHGTYEFKVLAANEDGIWNTAGDRIRFTIKPRFYNTYWFYFSSVFFAAMLFLGILRWRVYAEREHNKELSLLVKEKTTELRDINKELHGKNKELEDAHNGIIHVNKKLKVVNTNLEEKVQERTKDLKSTLDKLMQSSKELDTFIYRASHDLKGPTASLLGLAMLGKKSYSDKGVIELFDQFELISSNMNRVLNKLITRHYLSNDDVSYQLIDIKKQVDSILKPLSHLENFDHIKFDLNYDPSMVIYSDVSLIKVVLENLIENAFVFHKRMSEHDKYVKLSIHKNKSLLSITVEDNGTGIQDLYISKIYNLFFRGSQKSKGNGLGLYLVSMAVKKLNGKIKVKSEYAKYTRFEITLPNKEIG